MDEINSVFKSGNLHHAYGVVTWHPTPTAEEIFLQAAKRFKLPAQGNPDFWHLAVERLSLELDHHTRIKDWHSRRPIYGKKICVIETNRLSLEAQNALLKVFEETNLDSHFFLVLPHLNSLLPTLLSRLQILDLSRSTGRLTADDQPKERKKKDLLIDQDLFALGPKERLDLVKRVADKKSPDEAYRFLSLLSGQLYRRYLGSENRKERRLWLESAEMVTKCQKWLLDRSPSVKNILEYVVLNLPTEEEL